MKAYFIIVILAFALTACAPNGNTVLVYGIKDQDVGAAAYAIHDRETQQLVLANGLRPENSKEDWTKYLSSISLITIQNDYLYYYLPEPSKSQEDAHAKIGGIYRIKLSSTQSAEIVVPSQHNLNCVQKQPGGINVVAVGENGKVFLFDISSRTVRELDFENTRAVSWTCDGHYLVASHGNDILIIDPITSAVLKQFKLDGLGDVRQVFSNMAGSKYLIQNENDIVVFDVQSNKTTYLNKTVIPTATGLSFDATTGVAYIMVPNEHDGRNVFAFDITNGRESQIAHGVFNDTINIVIHP